MISTQNNVKTVISDHMLACKVNYSPMNRQKSRVMFSNWLGEIWPYHDTKQCPGLDVKVAAVPLTWCQLGGGSVFFIHATWKNWAGLCSILGSTWRPAQASKILHAQLPSKRSLLSTLCEYVIKSKNTIPSLTLWSRGHSSRMCGIEVILFCHCLMNIVLFSLQKCMSLSYHYHQKRTSGTILVTTIKL